MSTITKVTSPEIAACDEALEHVNRTLSAINGLAHDDIEERLFSTQETLLVRKFGYVIREVFEDTNYTEREPEPYGRETEKLHAWQFEITERRCDLRVRDCPRVTAHVAVCCDSAEERQRIIRLLIDAGVVAGYDGDEHEFDEAYSDFGSIVVQVA